VLWRKGSNGGEMILQGQCVTEILQERRDVTVSNPTNVERVSGGSRTDV
jgi:hypothetical protein